MPLSGAWIRLLARAQNVTAGDDVPTNLSSRLFDQFPEVLVVEIRPGWCIHLSERADRTDSVQ